jgi:outer membrane protein insertion porin family
MKGAQFHGDFLLRKARTDRVHSAGDPLWAVNGQHLQFARRYQKSRAGEGKSLLDAVRPNYFHAPLSLGLAVLRPPSNQFYMSFRRIFLLCIAAIAALSPIAQLQAQRPTNDAPIVKSIEVQYAGPAAVSKEKIIANMRTRVGAPYDERAIEEDIRNLYSTGNITNVRIFGTELTRDSVKVIVIVMAKAQISEVIVNGPSRVKPSRVRKEISVKPGDPLNEATLEADRQKLIGYYAERGFSEADVQYTVEADERRGTARVIFNINEGGKFQIRSVKFQGNEHVKAADIRKVIKSRPKFFLDFLSKGGRVNSDQLRDDQNAIRDLFQSRGYIDVQVADAQLNRDGSRVDILWVITEGPQYKVGKVNFVGIQLLPVDKVEKVLKTRTGNIYSPQNVRSDIKAIEDVYGALGYVDLRIGAAVNPGAAQVVDVEFKLEEGVQSYVEHVNISGNTRTKDKVVRREVLVAPGDVFNTVRVDASKKRLDNLNYFSKVDVYPSETLVPGRKDLNILVEEKRTGSFNFGAGFSSIDSLIGFAEVTQANFDITRWPYFTGGGQKFRLRAQYGLRRKDFILALTEPYFLDYKISVGGEIFYRDATFISDVYAERRYGFDLNVRRALTDFTYMRFGYRIEDTNIHDVDDDVSAEIKSQEGSSLKSELSAGITYDTRDSVFLTRKGERITLDTFISGGFLGGDIQTYGWDLRATKYFNLAWDTILTLDAELASVNAWGGESTVEFETDEVDKDGNKKTVRVSAVPIYDRLYLGGSNNLRGFRFRDVSPKDEDGEPIGGASMGRFTVEYTFPIVEKIRGAVFYDVGFVNQGEYKFGGGVASDVGIGVRLDLPIGPVRIDYGFPLQHDEFNGGSGKFNFNIGYQF